MCAFGVLFLLLMLLVYTFFFLLGSLFIKSPMLDISFDPLLLLLFILLLVVIVASVVVDVMYVLW